MTPDDFFAETLPEILFLFTFEDMLRRVIRFYVDGFREMTVGRTLWIIILLKLFVLFAVLKLFFMPDPLAGKSPAQRSSHLLEELTPEADAPAPHATPHSKPDSICLPTTCQP